MYFNEFKICFCNNLILVDSVFFLILNKKIDNSNLIY